MSEKPHETLEVKNLLNVSKIDLVKVSPEQAKQIGQNLASVLINFRTQAIKEGLTDNQAETLLKSIVEVAGCADGYMAARV